MESIPLLLMCELKTLLFGQMTFKSHFKQLKVNLSKNWLSAHFSKVTALDHLHLQVCSYTAAEKRNTSQETKTNSLKYNPIALTSLKRNTHTGFFDFLQKDLLNSLLVCSCNLLRKQDIIRKCLEVTSCSKLDILLISLKWLAVKSKYFYDLTKSPVMAGAKPNLNPLVFQTA